MPGERLSMRKIREVLRLRLGQGLPQRAVAQSLRLSQGAVHGYIVRARRAGLGWPLPEGLDDIQLEALLFPPPSSVAAEQRPVPDWAVVHRELRRPNMTLSLLWEEYRGGTGAQDGFGYSWFCDLYREWVGRLKPTLRQVHTAGERVFVDFAGHTMEVIDGATGEIHRAEIFVAVLGASSYTFARSDLDAVAAGLALSRCRRQPTRSVGRREGKARLASRPSSARQHAGLHRRRAAADRQRQPARRDHARLLLRAAGQAHLRRHGIALRHGGHPGASVQATRQGQEPARAKAGVEVGVQVVQRWILARLGRRRFFSLAKLNQAIRELVDQLNDRPMRGWGTTQRALYEQVNRPALSDLPPTP